MRWIAGTDAVALVEQKAHVLERGVNALRPKGRRLIMRLSELALIAFGGRLAAEVR